MDARQCRPSSEHKRAATVHVLYDHSGRKVEEGVALRFAILGPRVLGASRRVAMVERAWDGEDAYDNSPIRRKISDLGPTKAYSPIGPINANSKTIRDYLDVMRTRYISVWQLAALAGGLQAFLFLISPQEQNTAASLLFEQVQHWRRRSPHCGLHSRPAPAQPRPARGRREPALPG